MGLAMFKYTPNLKSTITCYEDVKRTVTQNVENVVVLGGYGSLNVTGNAAIQ